MTSYPPPNAGGPPSPSAAGQNPPAYGAPVPPAPPATSYQSPVQDVKAPPVAWLVVLAGLLGLIGGVTAWFRPEGKFTQGGQSVTQHVKDSVFSWDDGKIGLLGPILLLVIGIGVASLLLGRTPARFSRGSHPVTSAGKAAIGVGVVSLVCVVVAWFFVKSQYKFADNGSNYSWDDYIKLAKESGIKLELSRGAQIGFYLTIVGGILAIVGGVLMLVMHKNTPAPVAQPGGYPPAAPQGYGQHAQGAYPPPAPSGFGPPAQGACAPPAQGAYVPPAQGGYPQPAQPPSLEK